MCVFKQYQNTGIITEKTPSTDKNIEVKVVAIIIYFGFAHLNLALWRRKF